MKYFYPILLMIASLIAPTSCIVKTIQFDQNCGGYLKQTADANTAEIALERITKAIKYIERKHLTNGYTSILYETEDENVGFWYQNIKACQKELEACMDGSQLEKSNVLMKVRESLTDDTQLTIPLGISRYPDNTEWMIFGLISLFVFSGSLFRVVYLASEE